MPLILLAALVLFQQAPVPNPPARPDFSGVWVLDDSGAYADNAMLAAMLGTRFRATQTTKTLSLDIEALGGKFAAVYNLDGSDSKILSPVGPDNELETVISRATWEGDRLVIRTRATERENGVDVPIESVRVMYLDAAGRLLLERSGTPERLVRKSLSVYRRDRK
jgi:hypothetical protein